MMCCSPAAKARVAVRTELVPQTTTDLKTRFMVLPFFASALFFGPAAFQTRAASKCHCIVIALCDEAILRRDRVADDWLAPRHVCILNRCGEASGQINRSVRGRGDQMAAEVNLGLVYTLPWLELTPISPSD